MQLADSLNRLGTETAFEVLARAKALEASGRRIIHLQIGEPDFTTPRHIIDAGRKAWADGETHYCPAPGLPVLREACAAHLSRHRGLEIDPGNIVVAPGRQAVPVLRRARHLQPGRRGHLPEPRLPDLRVRDPLGRRHAGAAADHRGPRLRVQRRRPGRAAHAEDQARDPQLARQPDGRHRAARAQRADGEAARRPRLLDPLGRGLLRDALRGRARHDRLARGPARAHDPARRLLEDVRDDGLAPRLRRAAEAAGRADHAPDHQLGLVHGPRRAARRRGGARRARATR